MFWVGVVQFRVTAATVVLLELEALDVLEVIELLLDELPPIWQVLVWPGAGSRKYVVEH